MAAAQTLQTAEWQTRRFRGVEIREALLEVFRDRGSFVLDPRVHGRVSGSVKDGSTNDLLDLARQVHATVRVEGDVVVVVGIELPKPAKHAGDDSITFSFRNIRLAAAVQHLFDMANDGSAKSVETRAVGYVDLRGTYATFDQAIRAVVDSAGAALAIADGKYTVVRRELLSDADWSTSTVAVSMTGADIRDVLRQLFRQVNVNYTIAPDVQGVVSCDLHGPFQAVLMRLLAAVNGYYLVESGVVQILTVRRPDRPSTVTRAEPRPSLSINIPPRFRKVVVPAGLAFKEVPLSQALSQLFARLALRYRGPTQLTEAVTSDLGGLPLDKALESLLGRASLQVDWVDGVFVIKPSSFIPRGITMGGGPADWLLGHQDPVGWVTASSSP